MKIKYEIYSRPGCHLCEEMLDQLGEIDSISRDEIKVLNIETNPDLFKKFQKLIPVLFVNGREVCNGRLDKQALIETVFHMSSGSS